MLGNPARIPVSHESQGTEEAHHEAHSARARIDTDPACLRADGLTGSELSAVLSEQLDVELDADLGEYTARVLVDFDRLGLLV